jgi:hypothetical protein
MKNRLLWVALVIAASVGFYFAMVKPAVNPASPSVTMEDLKKMRPPQQLPPPELPRPVIADVVVAPPVPPPIAMPAMRTVVPPTKLEIPIQDGVTLDFSSGAAQARAQGSDADALKEALKEMSEATKDIKFDPTKGK